jgi:hypothetical protein
LIADELGAALGHEVEVSPGKDDSYQVEIAFDSVDDALALARRLRVRVVA